jgi:hypothetical protein
MPDETLRVDIRLRDFATRQLKRVAGAFGRFAATVTAKIRAATAAIFSMRGALIALAGVAVLAKVGKSFIRTAADIENMRLTLSSLLGDVKEANSLFDDLAKFAGKVPFALEEIMQVGTMFAGTFKGGREEIMKMMPIVADIAAVAKASGITFRQTGEQIQRMFSAGAASADMFREKGILAMLGFQAGVSYTTEQTREMVIKAWEDTGSKFRGTAQKMGKNWDGIMSMIGDAWFKFQRKVMESGIFDQLKEAAKVFLDKMGGLEKIAPEFGKSIVESMKQAVLLGARLADGFTVARKAWKLFQIAVMEIRVGLDEGPAPMLHEMAGKMNELQGGASEFWKAWQRTLEPMAKAKDHMSDAEFALRNLKEDADEIGGEDSAFAKASKWISDMENGLWGSKDAIDKMTSAQRTFNQTLLERMTGPMKRVREDQDRQRKVQEDSAKALEREKKALEDVGGSWGIITNFMGIYLDDLWKAVSLQIDMENNYKALRDIERKRAEDLAKDNERTIQAAQEMAKIRYSEELEKQRKVYQKIFDQVTAIGGVLASGIERSIDQALEGTFRWQKALQDTARDLAKLLLRQAIAAGIQLAAGAIAGAAAPTPAGPSPTPEYRPPVSFWTARGAVVRGGVGLPSFQRGGVITGPTALVAGDNRSRQEGLLPLERMPGGDLGVKASGGGTVVFNINTIDSRGVEQFLFENREKIQRVTGMSQDEGRTGRGSM